MNNKGYIFLNRFLNLKLIKLPESAARIIKGIVPNPNETIHTTPPKIHWLW
jgi:hypothetical protein